MSAERLTSKKDIKPTKPSNCVNEDGLSHVKLSMFEPGALKGGQLDELITTFYGHSAKWLGAYTENNQETRKRESDRRERYLQRHPDVTKSTYARDRKKRLEALKEKARERINKHFRKAVAKRFGTTAPDRFAETAFVHASSAMNKVAETVFPDSGVVALLNETTQQPISPASMVRDAVRPDYVHALKQEILQRALLALVAAELESRSSAMQGRKKLSKIQALLGEKLFDGKKGVTETLSVSGVYDNATNEPIIVVGPETGQIYQGDVGKDKHIKTIDLTVRKILGSRIRVHTSHNVKSPESGITKAMIQAQKEKAKSEDDTVMPLKTVFDTHRILFAVDGGIREVGTVYERIKKLFMDPKNQKHFADLDDSDRPIMCADGQIQGRVTKVQDRRLQKDTPGKSEHVNFRRILVHFDGLSVPIEIKIQGMRDFLRDEFHVGHYDPQTGTYKGAAHDLYDINRAISVLPYFIPDSSIPEEFDRLAELKRTQDITAAKLKASVKKVKKI